MITIRTMMFFNRRWSSETMSRNTMRCDAIQSVYTYGHTQKLNGETDKRERSKMEKTIKSNPIEFSRIDRTLIRLNQSIFRVINLYNEHTYFEPIAVCDELMP